MSLNITQVFSKEKNNIKNGQHIFYDILKKDISVNRDSNKLKFYYYFFAQIEECLTYTRSKYYSIALSKIQNLKKNIQIHSPNDDNITAIFLPMLAYYKLCQGETEKSIQCLKKSIYSLNKVEKAGIIEAKDAKFEQHLNICRVYIKSGKIKKGISESLILFKERFIITKSNYTSEYIWSNYFEYFIQSIILSISEKPSSFSIKYIIFFIKSVYKTTKENKIFYPQLEAFKIFLNIDKKELISAALININISNFMKMLFILYNVHINKDSQSRSLYIELINENNKNQKFDFSQFKQLSQLFEIDKS